ncbi:MAG: hypothetical protein ACXVNN_02550 [Bacteroidia bacterium]
MNINKNNYEAFFLDYHEGNLSPQQVADLLLFIEQHPELKEEFESFENFTLEDFSGITFENKSGLKKEITNDNKDEYFIRSVEDTLSSIEKNLLDNFIKQHPQYIADLNLFQKTKLNPDSSIVFENKESLKHIAVSTDDLLIASIEGLLSKEETVLLSQQLTADVEMQHNLSLYKQTRLIPDASIVFEGKEELKRKERKAIPLFYYVAIAASLLFLFGLYFVFNNNNNSDEQKIAKTTEPKVKIQKENQTTNIKDQENNLAQVPVSNKYIIKKSNIKKQHDLINKKDLQTTPAVNDQLSSANNQRPTTNIVKNSIENTPPQIANNESLTANNKQQATSNQSLALTDNKNKTNSSNDFLTIREIAVEKIKEKTLDENTLASQKKNGRLKRFSGWDFAQIVTKGISKLTGRDLEVKPTYNDDGDVTAYALGNGIERTTGK